MDGEIVVARRRQWTAEEKAALMAEVEAEGGQVSVVAQRHGISKSLLYNWRSAWKAAGLAARARAVPPAEFVQVGVVAEASGQERGMPAPHRPGIDGARRVVEIDLPDGVRVRVDSGVNARRHCGGCCRQ